MIRSFFVLFGSFQLRRKWAHLWFYTENKSSL